MSTFAIVFSGISVYRNSITARYNAMAYQVVASYFTDEELADYVELVTLKSYKHEGQKPNNRYLALFVVIMVLGGIRPRQIGISLPKGV